MQTDIRTRCEACKEFEAQERCEVCNCVGYLLDVQLDQQKVDQLDVPF